MTRAQELMALNQDITPEVLDQVDAIVDRFKQKPGSLIPVLEQCQETLGYIPVELQEYVGRALNIPGSTIYGVVTFYSLFSTTILQLDAKAAIAPRAASQGTRTTPITPMVAGISSKTSPFSFFTIILVTLPS